MQNIYIDLINGAFHILLLLVKIFMIYIFIKNLKSIDTPNDKKMLIYSPIIIFLSFFCIIYIYAEIYFLYNFYNNIDFYIYEFLSIFDQILLTIITVFNFMKGDKKNGKN